MEKHHAPFSFYSELSYLGKVVVLAAVYYATAKVGLSLDAVGGFATLVWPPTGISLAVLLLFGRRLWPGVFAGAFLANFSANAPISVAAGIAAGNTLEALVGAYLIMRFAKGFSPALDRGRDSLALIIFGAFFSTLLSATMGVTSLWLGNTLSADIFDTWRAWWIGDVLADLTIAPFILVWAAGPVKPRRESIPEILCLVLSVILVYFVVFGNILQLMSEGIISYLALIPLVWASLRFGVKGGVTTMFFIALLSIWATISGKGPFVGSSLAESLLFLQLFTMTVAPIILVLSSVSTEHRNAENEIRELNRKLAKDIRALKKLDQLKTEFVNIAAHELKTPLIPIIGYGEMLKKKKLSTGTRSKLEIMLRSARREQQLVNDILDVARLEAGTMKFDMANVNIAFILKDCIKEIMPGALEKNLKVESKVPDTLPAVRGDAWRLAQVFNNLLGNAVKFSGKGTITISAEAHKDHVMVSVRDTGAGISKADMPKLFNMFFQADAGLERSHEGTGLGLVIVRKIVEAHGGDVWATSRLGSGSTFKIRLPYRGNR